MTVLDNFALDDQDHDWTLRAACKNADPDLFFPERGQSTAAAKAICRTCPVRTACLEYSIKHDIRHGIWGGEPEDMRRGIRKARDLARTRGAAA